MIIILIQIVSDLCVAINDFGDVKYRTQFYQFLRPHYDYRYLNKKFGCRAGWRVAQSSNEHLSNNGEVAPLASKLWQTKNTRKKL